MKQIATTWSIALLISGATIGAGILGLPIQTGQAGFIPSFVAITVLWLFMFISGSIIAEHYLRAEDKGIDLPGIFERAFGTSGKYVAAADAFYVLIFFIPATFIALYGMNLVLKANTILMLIMGVAFIVLITTVSGEINFERYSFQDWEYIPFCLPVILTAFVFHNIIPSICRNLDHDKKAIRKAMFVGTLLPCVVNIIWVAVVTGALPLESIEAAAVANQPATVPLASFIKSNTLTMATMIFSFAAIFTSYVAVAVGLRNFFHDMFSWGKQEVKPFWPIFFTYVPPLLVVLIYPQLFLSALDIAGGVGVVIIFGILPAMMMIKRHHTTLRYITGWFLIIIFIAIMLMTIAKEANLITIKPHIEYWKSVHQVKS
ncbi:MAG: hypothetical protein B6I31_05465 [Desulfobacteraceae bacterium 4572_19]|nr:MAG: hypothetical protein B6I31_05465 [Desulfobacteraceae bacterium 4572_19]